MKREIFNKIISRVAPWITGIVAFWLVTNIFFAPQRDGMSLDQGDIRQYAGMSEDIRQMREATGEDPQWTGNMFSGMPAYMIDIEYPTQSVKQTVGSVVKVIDSPMNMIFFAMVVMMLSVVLMGINPWIGIVAGLAYGLSTYFFLIVGVGHITKMLKLSIILFCPPIEHVGGVLVVAPVAIKPENGRMVAVDEFLDLSFFGFYERSFFVHRIQLRPIIFRILRMVVPVENGVVETEFQTLFVAFVF